MARRVWAACATGLGLLLAGAAGAQESGVDEVVVTAARIARPDQGGEVPAVFVARRADNLVMKIEVVCDTRDPARRLEELRQTLRNLIRAQRPPTIALGVGEGRVGVFDERAINDVIETDAEEETSSATLVVKTQVGTADSVDAAVERIRAYVERTPKAGRTEVIVSDEIDITVVNPGQYRAQILAAIAADARSAAAALGQGYGVRLTGLEQAVQYRQSGPLEARLFIPYTLSVEPVRN